MDPPASFPDRNPPSAGPDPTDTMEIPPDVAAFMQNLEPAGQQQHQQQKSTAASRTPSAAVAVVTESLRQTRIVDDYNHDAEEDGPMMMSSPVVAMDRPQHHQHHLDHHGFSTMQDIYRHQQQQDQEQFVRNYQPQHHDEGRYHLAGSSGSGSRAMTSAVDVAAARLPRATSDEASSRYADGSSATTSYDARPNLKAVPSEDETNETMEHPQHHSSYASPAEYAAAQARPPQRQHTYPPQMRSYEEVAGGTLYEEEEELPPVSHQDYSRDQRHALHPNQQQQMPQERLAPTSAVASRPRPQPITETRPHPRPGTPKAPTTPAAEPPIPKTKLGRRCLAQKWQRTPDKTLAEVVVEGLLEEPPSRDSLLQMQCAGCKVLLQAPQTSLLIECPNCEGVFPVAECRLHKNTTAVVRSNKSVPTYLYVTLLLCLVFPTTVVGAVAAPLLDYDLNMAACRSMEINSTDSSKHSFLNYGSLGPSMELIRNTNATSCVLGMGVEVDGSSETNATGISLFGSQTMGVVQESLQSQDMGGVTMSFWMRHAEDMKGSFTSSRFQPIISIGSTVAGETIGDSATICDEKQVDFQLSVNGERQMEVIYRTNDPFFSPCQQLVMGLPEDASATRLAHVAVSLKNFKQEIFYNGELLGLKREPFGRDLEHWNPSSEMHFFSRPGIAGPRWMGQLFQISLIPGASKLAQVQSMISEGLPPTQPFAIPVKAHILEDADQENELQEIELVVSYLDREVDQLLSAVDLPHQPAASLQLYITRFPSRGHLKIAENSQNLVPSTTVPTFAGENSGLVYIPPLNEYSEFPGAAFTTFDYCYSATKSLIHSSSQCVSATVSIVIDPVNDPPVALAPPTFLAREGIQEGPQAIRLTGSDVDNGDSVQAIKITSPPSLGRLHLSVGSFRSTDDLLHKTELSSINYTFAGGEGFVGYQFTGYDKAIVEDQSVFDSFFFQVQDSHGAWSDEMEAEIHVVPSIVPLSLGPVIWDLPSLDKNGTYFFAWNDSSGLNRTLGLFLASLPSKGYLLDGDSIISTPNSIVAPSAWSKGTNLSFQASPEACSEEDLLFTDDSFSVHVVALDADQQVRSISNGTNVTLRISCKIEPIHLGTSHESISVVASSPKLDNPCSGYNFNFSRPVEESCVNQAALFDIHAYNTKRQPEVVLISLATTNGLLTINTNLPEAVFPFGDQPVMRSSIHILLPADRLDETLAAVHFQSRIPGEDEIHVVVQSGYCSHKERLFLDQDELMTGPECIQTELIIPVDVQVSLADSDQYLYQEFPWIPLPFAFCMLLFIKLRGKSREILLQDEGATCNLTSVDSKEEVKWKEYEDPKTGQKYYHNSEDGEVTWSPPFNEECILCSK